MQSRKAPDATSTAAYKPPSMRAAPNPIQLASRFDVLSLSGPTQQQQPTSSMSASKLSPTAKAFVRSGQSDKSSADKKTSSDSNNQEAGIDYFDMTD